MSLTDELEAIENGIGATEVAAWDLLRLGGSEPLAALDRVVSQEVRSLRDGGVRPALLLAPKGQFRALMVVLHAGGEAMVLAPAGRGTGLAAMLSGYLKFSRVTVTPTGWGGGAWRVVGPRWRDVGATLGLAGIAAGAGCATVGETGDRILLVRETFAGVDGATVFAESGSAREAIATALAAAGAVALSAGALDAARVAAGFPAWGSELTEGVLPPEVGIETTAISYTKGCYVGQETMARMRTYGRPNWRLARLHQLDGPQEAPPLPADLVAAGSDKAKARLTSWARHPERGGIALALVHRTIADDAVLAAGDRRFAIVRPPA